MFAIKTATFGSDVVCVAELLRRVENVLNFERYTPFLICATRKYRDISTEKFSSMEYIVRRGKRLCSRRLWPTSPATRRWSGRWWRSHSGAARPL